MFHKQFICFLDQLGILQLKKQNLIMFIEYLNLLISYVGEKFQETIIIHNFLCYFSKFKGIF